MFTTAEALEQSNATPTDWSKFEGTLMPARAGEPGGLPPGMGPGWDDKLHVRFFMRPRIDPVAVAEGEPADLQGRRRTSRS